MKLQQLIQTQYRQLLSWNQTWIQELLFRHVDNLFYQNKYGSSRRKITATVLMILISLLPYTDIFLGLFIDVSAIKLHAFPNLASAIWSFSMCVTPLLLLLVIPLKPHFSAYFVTSYVYVTMFLGFLFLELGVNISSDWLFRAVTLSITFVLIFIYKVLKDYFKILILKDDITNEIKNL